MAQPCAESMERNSGPMCRAEMEMRMASPSDPPALHSLNIRPMTSIQCFVFVGWALCFGLILGRVLGRGVDRILLEDRVVIQLERECGHAHRVPGRGRGLGRRPVAIPAALAEGDDDSDGDIDMRSDVLGERSGEDEDSEEGGGGDGMSDQEAIGGDQVSGTL